jgi:hypothetical protein
LNGRLCIARRCTTGTLGEAGGDGASTRVLICRAGGSARNERLFWRFFELSTFLAADRAFKFERFAPLKDDDNTRHRSLPPPADPPPPIIPRTFLHAGRTALTTGVPAVCITCAPIAHAPAQYSGDVRKLTSTPLFVLFRHRAQCMWCNLRVNPPCLSCALVHLHRFSGMR